MRANFPEEEGGMADMHRITLFLALPLAAATGIPGIGSQVHLYESVYWSGVTTERMAIRLPASDNAQAIQPFLLTASRHGFRLHHIKGVLWLYREVSDNASPAPLPGTGLGQLVGLPVVKISGPFQSGFRLHDRIDLSGLPAGTLVQFSLHLPGGLQRTNGHFFRGAMVWEIKAGEKALLDASTSAPNVANIALGVAALAAGGYVLLSLLQKFKWADPIRG